MPRIGIDAHAAAVPFDNLVDNGQPKARARRLGGKIGRKDGRLNVSGNTGAIVADRKAEVPPVRRQTRPHMQVPALAHGLHGIEKEVEQSLGEAFNVDPYRRQIRGHVKGDLYVSGAHIGFGQTQGPIDDFGQIGVRGVDGSGPGKFQQFGDDPVQPVHFVNHALGGFLFTPAGQHALGDVEGHALDGAQGIAHLMRHTGGQMPKGRQAVVAPRVCLQAFDLGNVAQNKHIAQKNAVLIAHAGGAEADDRACASCGEDAFALKHLAASGQFRHQRLPVQTRQPGQRRVHGRIPDKVEHAQGSVVDHGHPARRIAGQKAQRQIGHHF